MRRVVARGACRTAVRHLGSWAARFEAARGAPIESRLQLSAALKDVWVLHQDEAEAEALEAEAEASSGSTLTFVLSVEDTAVGVLRAALMPGQAGASLSGLLIGAQCDPALPLAAVGSPLIDAARQELTTRGAERVLAVAPLPGLCAWVVSESCWSRPDFDAEAAGAIEAVARGVPRPGHSVLGVGTFKAARPAFETLALEYAKAIAADHDTEVAMFARAGAAVQSVNWMHSTDAEALSDCAGCTVTLRF